MDALTAYVKKYDRKLYCDRLPEGKLAIFREGYYWDSSRMGEDVISVLRPTPHFVFALTDNWKKDGNPAEWGFLPIWNRLKAIDLWNRDIVSEIEKNYDEHAQSCERKRKNDTESFLYEFRSQFAKTFNDVNTANLKKTDLRKKMEKSKWQL